jgi:hypothetical protein
MIDKETAEKFVAVIHRHSEIVTLDLLFDLVRALGLTLHVEVIDREHVPD